MSLTKYARAASYMAIENPATKRLVMDRPDWDDQFAETESERNAQTMTDFTKYRRSQIAELRPYKDGESMDRVSISAPDKEAGSPKAGDMIARNPKNHDDQWLVAAQYFADNFEPA